MAKIETLRSLAWTPRPIPPLGVPPWSRRKHWFRWYVILPVLHVIWQFRQWRWEQRTGGRQEWFG